MKESGKQWKDCKNKKNMKQCNNDKVRYHEESEQYQLNN